MIPLLSIWFQPRKTFRYLIDNYDPVSVWMLAVMEGIDESFNWTSTCKMGERHDLDFISLLVLVVGPILGISSNWLGAFFTRRVGQMFGGKGSLKGLLTVMVWWSLPLVLMLPFRLVLVLLFGSDAFTTNLSVVANHSGNIGLIFLVYGWLFLRLIACIWSFVMMLVGISEAQSFTKWKALANGFIAGLLVYLIFGFPIYYIFHL